MPYVTSIEQMAQEKERRSLVSLLLEQKVGQVSASLEDHISTLSLQQLEALAIALLNFDSINDLITWLENPSERPAQQN